MSIATATPAAAHRAPATTGRAPRSEELIDGNGSSLAATAIAQSSMYATRMLRALPTQAGGSMATYSRLHRRGVLDDAISYAGYAADAVKNDTNRINDAFADMINSSVINVLSGVRRLGAAPTGDDIEVVRDELAMAAASARNVERHVDSPTQGS